jgi:hypothetical protein
VESSQSEDDGSVRRPADVHRVAEDWVRLAAPSERPASGLTPSRFAIAVLPATAAVIVLRRRARRRAGATAWRYRTHGEVSAENQRIVDAHEAVEPESPSQRQVRQGLP